MFPLKQWADKQMGVPAAAPAAPPMPPPGAPVHPPPAPAAPAAAQAVSPKHMLTPEQSAWVTLDPRSPERADNPPAWVDDEAAWEKAKAAAKKDWGSYDEPWAVVATIYKNMTGG